MRLRSCVLECAHSQFDCRQFPIRSHESIPPLPLSSRWNSSGADRCFCVRDISFLGPLTGPRQRDHQRKSHGSEWCGNSQRQRDLKANQNRGRAHSRRRQRWPLQNYSTRTRGLRSQSVVRKFRNGREDRSHNHRRPECAARFHAQARRRNGERRCGQRQRNSPG